MHPRFLLQTSAHKKEKLLFISAGQKISIVVLFEKRPIFLSLKTNHKFVYYLIRCIVFLSHYGKKIIHNNKKSYFACKTIKIPHNDSPIFWHDKCNITAFFKNGLHFQGPCLSSGGVFLLDTGCWILDAGYWILDTGYLLLAPLRPLPFALCPLRILPTAL
jgi:hypothetical protein